MASPPNYNAVSPPAPSALALPPQRPRLSLPTGGTHRRQPSIASASSGHPLRQSSFPPADRYGSPGGSDSHAMYSPSESADFSDSEITSAISGPVADGEGTRKRKRGEKRNRGRPPKNPRGSQSLVNGAEDGKSKKGRDGSAAAEGDADEEDEDEDDDGLATGKEGLFEQDRFIANDRARIDLHQQMPIAQQERHDSWHRAKLKTADVRRLVNQTLSQSVPANVVTVVQAYTKMFAGILIEGAREVQSEWMAVEENRADGVPNPVAKRIQSGVEKKTKKTEKKNGMTNGHADQDANGHPHSDDTVPDEQPAVVEDDEEEDDERQNENMNLKGLIEECDRGPLLADHLRESLRRYKKSRYGGVVGFTGLSLEGRDVAAARVGGRRLFR